MTADTTRRTWLAQQATSLFALASVTTGRPDGVMRSLRGNRSARPHTTTTDTAMAATAEQLAPGLMQQLALRAVDAARSAGAQYADVRLTRTVVHHYNHGSNCYLESDDEEVGVGVRALVNGYWGFAASPYWSDDEVVRLAREATAIAATNAKGPPRTVELSSLPVVTGTWATPVKIDPFTISIEEKLDYLRYWRACAEAAGTRYQGWGFNSFTIFARQERVLATSAGTLVTQTVYESGSRQYIDLPTRNISTQLLDLDWAGKGWELVLEANIPEQFALRLDAGIAAAKVGAKRFDVGRYTLVCDGTTMASLVGETFGAGTQLDRALGYEANAHGTSFLTDPLAMAGTFMVAPPSVTVTANRSAPTQLATVQWDDEGIAPKPFTLIDQGRVVDFQTTQESAEWLAPYYRQRKGGDGTPSSALHTPSHACAAAPDASSITMQHMPNLELMSNPSAVRLSDLIAEVQHGLLIEDGAVSNMDFQARNGLLGGTMREITNGRLGKYVTGGTIQFNTLDLWKNLHALGGVSTQKTLGRSRFDFVDWPPDEKGQPAQSHSFTVRAAAATFPNQAVVDITRKA